MDNFIVSARKYRPVTFDSVVGQQHITGTLKNAIRNNQLAQAFLFCGPRGVGKTTCARILAKTINCEHITETNEACGECDSCKSFQNGNSFSIHELDAASNNSVDDIRSLIDQVRIPPQTGKYKIYIIDEVHMLSQQAFNAFLKTLEEPPSYAIFILATTEKHKILPTILSRCQIFDFNRIKVEDMASHLASIANKEGISFEADGLHVIAQKADGGLRDALSMFDQIVSFSNKQLTYKAVIDNLNILDYDYYFQLLDAIQKQDAANALLIFDSILNKGFDGGHFISGLSGHVRNLLVSKDPSTLKLLEVSENVKKRYLEQSQQLSSGLLLSALNIANQCEVNYRTSKNQRLQVELALLKMCHIASAIALAQNGIPAQAELKKKLPESGIIEPHKTTNTPPAVAQFTNPVAKQMDTTHPGGTSSNAPQANPAASNTNTPASTSSAPTAPETSKPAFKAWGSFKTANSLPNLNTIFDEKKGGDSDEPALVEGSEYLEVTQNVFLSKWNFFAEKLKADNKITLFTIMTASTPTLNGVKIEVEVENAVQSEQLKLGKIDILNYLRVELRNFSLDLHVVMVEKTKDRKPYTAQEKYQAMVAKNPMLEELRKTFDLGLS
ncbi:DNA polymerase III subunit gamma/tau [Sphingobacterium sp. DK4209]|uniref:DNA polymerase III subunit gamma/tau n=1 Tax=Sphingobacterium zhuxiongii TaxID=2662364 RepID=A0A5Q0QI58_9SPHI|nr:MULTISPECIES: DNA polymerase III subunit gamma/tau [unclassified Sphingobacterium]MVZ67259.1 DNA polymerase III subunit gamma/tau [Sphingobacterium sp. DK4209]QGA27170.1 DNA polymerase III subunit gamma/tau [Sphingobacterium sp. dk4302]